MVTETIEVTEKPNNIISMKSKSTFLSNILKIFFVILHIIFGYDFGFIKYKSTRQKIIIKLGFAALPFVSAIAFIFIIYSEFSKEYIIWYVVLVIESYSYVLTLLLASERNTYQKFLEHLQWIDSKLKVDNSSYYFELKVILCCIISLVWTIWSGIYNVQILSSLYARITYFDIFPPTEIPFIVLFFIFVSTNTRLAALQKLTNEEPKQAQVLYKSLIESVENVIKPFNSIFVVTLCANIPSVMALMYEIVREAKTNGIANLYNYSWDYAVAAVFILTLFAPALAAGMLSTEVEKIKITLQDSLILENDEIRVRDIKRFLGYINTRPFKLYVLRIIPLDASLVVTSLNFSITYLIVILQLTHIY